MILNIVFLALSLVSGLSFVLLLLTSGEFDSYITPLDKKEFSFPEVYGVGFKLIKMFKMDFKGREAKQVRDQVVILYGERYADYYLRVMYAQKFSLIYMVFAIVAALSALATGTDKLLLLGLGVLTCGLLYYFFTNQPKDKVKKRSERFMDEFPNAVSTIALLVNSGMILREAWREVSMSAESELYMEMRKVNDEIDNGVSEVDALFNFAARCVTPDIKKFTSFIVQGLEKGSKDLADALRNQTDELWQTKKQVTLRRGELASGKLMIPLMIMFVGVLIMVMGPILTNLGL